MTRLTRLEPLARVIRAGLIFPIGIDEQYAACDRIEVRITLYGDPVFDLCAHHLRYSHQIFTCRTDMILEILA